MKKIDIYEELKSNDYPGRGIVIGKSADGKSAVTAPTPFRSSGSAAG